MKKKKCLWGHQILVVWKWGVTAKKAGNHWHKLSIVNSRCGYKYVVQVQVVLPLSLLVLVLLIKQRRGPMSVRHMLTFFQFYIPFIFCLYNIHFIVEPYHPEPAVQFKQEHSLNLSHCMMVPPLVVLLVLPQWCPQYISIVLWVIVNILLSFIV